MLLLGRRDRVPSGSTDDSQYATENFRGQPHGDSSMELA
jgi:hypothetical protein